MNKAVNTPVNGVEIGGCIMRPNPLSDTASALIAQLVEQLICNQRRCAEKPNHYNPQAFYAGVNAVRKTPFASITALGKCKRFSALQHGGVAA